jgi:hypothetical protein
MIHPDEFTTGFFHNKMHTSQQVIHNHAKRTNSEEFNNKVKLKAHPTIYLVVPWGIILHKYIGPKFYILFSLISLALAYFLRIWYLMHLNILTNLIFYCQLV